MLCSSSTPEVPPPCCFDFLHLHLPSQAGSLSTSLGKMSARPGQAYVCITGTHRELQVRRWKNLVPGEGQMASHQPITALRTLKPTLGFLSEIGLLMSLHPPCPWQSTQPAMLCQPMSWERHYNGSTPSATCLLSLFIKHRWPSTGLHSGLQASNLLSGRLTEDGQGWGGLPSSLPPAPCPRPGCWNKWRNPDGNCCHLIMRAYDISQEHLTISCGLRQIKWNGTQFEDYSTRVMADKTACCHGDNHQQTVFSHWHPHSSPEGRTTGGSSFLDQQGLEPTKACGSWPSPNPILPVRV